VKIKTQELKEVVNSLLAGTSTKDLVVQMAHLVFVDTEILAYNDRISILVPFETGITCSIPAEDLSKVLAGITDKELVMEEAENAVTITSKKTTAEIFTEIESRVVEDFFSKIDFDAMEWDELPIDFLDQLALSRFSASGNALDANNLFCIHIKKHMISSGDGHRLSLLKMDSAMKEVLIPSSSVNDIVSFQKFDEYAVHNGWLHLSNSESGMIVSCRTVEGDFPDFGKMFTQFKEVSEIELESNLIPLLQNMSGLVEGQSSFMRSVLVRIGKGETTVSGKKEGLQIEKSAENKHTEELVQFSISPDFLSHILTMTNTLSIGETSALFSSDTFQHLVQLPID
jgi:hypothetical protein